MDRGHRSNQGTLEESGQLRLFDEGGIDMGNLRRMRARVLASPDAAATRTALESDWRDFSEWCELAGRRGLPASSDTVGLYCVSCASERQHAVGTIERRLWAISRHHRDAGHASPVSDAVRVVMRGLARERGRAQKRKAAITVPELRRMVGTLDGRSATGARDQAILLLGFSTGLRSAELAALDRADVRPMRSGVVITVRRGKTDQEGRGRDMLVARGSGTVDPAGAVERWLRWRGAEPGPLFGVGSQWVYEVVKRSAEAAGLDASAFGAHSLRAGMITELDRQGVSVPAIMSRSGHRSYEMVARYVRRKDAASLDPLARRVRTGAR